MEMWRRLVKTNEPAHKSKAWVWRKHLTNLNFPTDLAKWSEAFYQWESEIREFERQFKKKIDENIKLSVLVHVAPKELQQSIFMHADSLDSYMKVRTYIEQYLSARNLWRRPQGRHKADSGVAPMDIGAINDKGKGDKGKKGKTKTEKGDPGKVFWNQQSWTPTWKGSSQQQGNPKGGSSNKGEKGKQAGKGEDWKGKRRQRQRKEHQPARRKTMSHLQEMDTQLQNAIGRSPRSVRN